MHNCVVCKKPFAQNRRTCSPACLAIRIKQVRELYKEKKIFANQANSIDFGEQSSYDDPANSIDSSEEREAVATLLNL